MKSPPEQLDNIEKLFHLANIWQLKGNIAAAETNYKQVIELNPSHGGAYFQLGLLYLKTGQVQVAADYFREARCRKPSDKKIQLYSTFVNSLLNTAPESSHLKQSVAEESDLADQPQGKINLKQRIWFPHHRSGWLAALNALKPLHNRGGVLLDTALESNFGWRQYRTWVNPPEVLERMKEDGLYDALATSEEKGIIPYREPWVGFFHNPHEMPRWHDYQNSPQIIFQKRVWRQSLKYCIGLFALSKHFAKWLRKTTQMPVSALWHPTEIPSIGFDFDRFMANRHKMIVQIGMWLRSMAAISRLPIGRHNSLGYAKVRLLHNEKAEIFHNIVLELEKKVYKFEINHEFETNTRIMGPLSNSEYDDMLAENIVFLYLYDAAANNTVVECIARATPLLVNPLPAVKEYLGPDYPLYYNDLEEAAAKALDSKLIQKAHAYLKDYGGRNKVTWDHFRHSFENSEVYQLIPPCRSITQKP